MTTLQFLGATGTVTGSRFLVRTAQATVLVDAGLFQGAKRDRLANWEPFPIDPAEIDAVVVTHGHIDHSGWLPGLARDGFTGPIFATTATCELCEILLPDAAHLQEEEARFANERGFSKHHPAQPLYTSDDADAAIALLEGVEFDSPMEVAAGVVARFIPAGHILGSASVHLTITDNDRTTTLLASGDLGRGNHPLIPGPGVPPAARTVLVESTYGDSLHPEESDEIEEFANVVRRTAKRGGVVLPRGVWQAARGHRDSATDADTPGRAEGSSGRIYGPSGQISRWRGQGHARLVEGDRRGRWEDHQGHA